MEKALGSRYRLGDQLGMGAMGRVFAGSDEQGKAYAFKVLRDELVEDPELVARFLQERSILVGLRHPNLVGVHDLVVEGETVAIVMDLVGGGDLRARLTAEKSLLPAEVARIGAGVAAALGAVHQAGVVHRDVKPENVLMDGTVPRLTDFGISRLATATDLGRRSLLVGTPQYLAPELGKGLEATPASDLYSLGILLYELCCGVTPFAGQSTFAVIRLHESALPGRPAGVPDQLWDVLAWLMAKRPSDRPDSAQQVATILDALVLELMKEPLVLPLTTPPPPVPLNETGLGTETVFGTAPPPPRRPVATTSPSMPTGVTVSPPKRRRRGRVVLTLVVVLALLTGGWFAFRPSSNAGPAPIAAPTTSAPASVAPAVDAPSVTTTAKPSVMPDVTGKKLAAAQDALPGIQVTTVDKIDATADDGTVIAQDPAAGAAIGDTVKLTVARQAQLVYLDSGHPASGEWSSSVQNANIAGKSYLHAVGIEVSANTDTHGVEYNISKGFRRFTATAGVDDNAVDSTLKMQLEVFADGREIFNKPVPYGTPVPVDLDISGVLRLRIQWEAVSGNRDICCRSSYLVLGTAELLGLPGEVPTSPTTTG
ncbi:protein kinase [Amycolatopsis mongoliensis]|uniref:non-specific serine/threonine protein kinase n=1 Tax=Amycolatopsis mongoliensis TaxID=715475 RepID=A0A9Y2JY70_9PSEU|nr:protein kinase [Amycolatopsis sp. 4-36]WIY05134.1 protein kinase [Amycolatopsis sp. 4-36]